jgi:Ca-activated chloride channel family protein
MRRASIFLLALLSLRAQDVTIQPRERRAEAKKTEAATTPNLRADSNLVLVPLTVTDKLGRPVTGLEKENFRVFDNKVEQKITQLGMDDEPVAVGFIFDVSGSIGGALEQYRRATHEFFTSADDKDEFFLVEFQSSAKLVVPLTRQVNQIEYQIMMTKSAGMTSLYDAVYLAASEIRKSKLTKKALILVSDGGENNSRYTYTELKNALRETDALLYSIGPSPDHAWGDNDGRLLKDISELTGGRLIEMDRMDLTDLAQKIIVDLRNRYVIGYVPEDKTRDGKYHHIQVQIAPPKGLGKLTAHWRTGYYAPDN